MNKATACERARQGWERRGGGRTGIEMKGETLSVKGPVRVRVTVR